MFATIPGRKCSLRVCLMLVAISTLITNVTKPNDHSGSEVELLDRAHLALENADICIPTGP